MLKRPELEEVQIGKPVFNKNGRQIGQVIRVHIADKPLPEEDEHEPASATAVNNDKEWLALIADVIEPDDRRAIELAKELWQKGYIKIVGNQLEGFRQYVFPNQLQKIDDQGVHLNVYR